MAVALHGTVAAQTPDTLAPGTLLLPDSAHAAYLDDTARRLVLGAKAARDTARLAIDAYTALIRERIGLEAPSFRRDRPLVHGERAVRIRWSRQEPDVAHVLGSRVRFQTGGLGESDSVEGLGAERFAADPLGDPFTFGFAVFEADGSEATTRSPLAPGAERHYQFRSGDTVSVQLGDGGTLRAVAVTAVPRYASIRLVSAIMWIDPESLGIARVAYRLAKKVDREFSWQLRRDGRWSPGLFVDAGPLDAADSALASDSPTTPPSLFDRLVNGVFNNSYPRLQMDLSTVVADYGLWEMRHWLPRRVRWRGYMAVADDVSASGIVPPPVPATIDWTVEVEDIRERGQEGAPGAPATAEEALALWREAGDSIDGALESADPGAMVTIIPADRRALATSDLLPPSFWEEDRGTDEAALAGIASELAEIGTGEGGDRTLAASPWLFDPPGTTLRLLRYNPVERLSVGTRLRRDFGWGRATLTTRIGTARVEAPDIDLTLQRDHPRSRILVSFYRALRSVDPGDRGTDAPLIFMTGDLADFHWSHGAAIRFLPPGGTRNWLSLRLFAERDVETVTDASRDRIGAAAVWRPWWGGNEEGSLGGGGRVSLRGVAGDNPYTRALAEAALAIPLPARLSLGVQTGTAGVWGDPAPQDLWRIGGTGAWLRGHAESVRGSRIHMARLDLQRPVRFLRLSLFGDWASALGHDFRAVGAGLVLMDGIIRVDAARGLRGGWEGGPEAVWRLHIRGDAFF